jgi:PAS domain-containing protein
MSSGSQPRFPVGTLIDAATLAMLLDRAYDAVAVRRSGGDILYWNRRAERTYGVWEGQLVHTHRDGTRVTVDSRWALDAAGGEQVELEINRDVTLRLAAEESARRREQQLRFITDSAPVLIAHCDLEHRFKFGNRPYAARSPLHPRQRRLL